MKKYLWLFVMSFCIGFLIQGVHESGHVLMMKLQGHNPTFTFASLAQSWNGDQRPDSLDGWTQISSPFDSEDVGYIRADSYYKSTPEAVVALLAGPIAGILFAFGGIFLAYKNRTQVERSIGIVVALCSSLFMLFYYVRSPMRVGGDEGFAAIYAGVSKYVFIVPLALFFLIAFVFVSILIKRHHFSAKEVAITLLGFALSGIVLSIANVRLIYPQVFAGNPLFVGVLGFSLPVLLTYLVALVGVMVLAYKGRQLGEQR